MEKDHRAGLICIIMNSLTGVRRGNFEIPTRGLRDHCSASELPALGLNNATA